MATLTLTCNGGTTLSYHSPSADLSSGTSVGTSAYFSSNYPSADRAENNRVVWGNVNYTNEFYDFSAGLLSFPGNNVLLYKEINNVTLSIDLERFYYRTQGSPDSGQYLRTSDRKYYIYIAPYRSSASLSNINKNNYKSNGSLGAYAAFDVTNQIPLNSQSATVSINITDLHKSWFGGGAGKYIISAGMVNQNSRGEIYVLPAYQIYECGEYYYENNGSIVALFTRSITKSTAKLTVTYNDVTQPAPTPLYPTGITVMEADSINFSWQYNSATAAGQKSATIQYKKTTADSWTTVTSSGAGTNYTLNTHLEQGAYAWRVAVTNAIDETSAYCDTQYFDIIGKPASPVINAPANKALTEITWQATGQEAIDLMFYDSNGNLLDHVTEATTEASYKPQFFLRGTYNIKLRIKNNTDLWSDFAQYGFTISGSAPSEGNLVVIPFEKSVRLEWTAPSDTNAVIVRKEKGVETILADTINGNTYEDKTVKSGVLYEYILRTWTDGYTDTPSKQVICKYSGAILSLGDEELHLEVSDDTFIPHTGAKERSHALDDFVGRDNPLLELGSAKRNRISKRFYVTPEELEKFFELTQDLKIYYRDDHNNAFMAAVTKQDYTNFNNSGYILQFELTRLAEEEVIFNV